MASKRVVAYTAIKWIIISFCLARASICKSKFDCQLSVARRACLWHPEEDCVLSLHIPMLIFSVCSTFFRRHKHKQTTTSGTCSSFQKLKEKSSMNEVDFFFCFHIFVGKFLGSLLRVLLLLYAAFYGTSFATRKHFKTRSGKLLTAGKWANGPNQRRVPPTASCLLRARAV